jgi:hypothetical protein
MTYDLIPIPQVVLACSLHVVQRLGETEEQDKNRTESSSEIGTTTVPALESSWRRPIPRDGGWDYLTGEVSETWMPAFRLGIGSEQQRCSWRKYSVSNLL